jgi:hypothetical protein
MRKLTEHSTRWIDTTMTLAIPSDERRILLRSFWLTLGLLPATLWLVIGWRTKMPSLAAAAIATLIVLGSLPFVHEPFAWRVYRAWNPRLVRPFAAIAAQVVTWICFCIVLVVGRSSASRMRLDIPAAPSCWTDRRSLPPDAFRSLTAAPSSRSASGAWVLAFFDAARQSGNLWALSLLPFLAALKLFTREEPEAVQANIYSLF